MPKRPGAGNRSERRGHRPRAAALRYEGGMVVRLPDDGDATLRQLRMLAQLAAISEGQDVDETEILRRLVAAEAARIAGPPVEPMPDAERAAWLARVAAADDAEDAQIE